MKFEEVLPLVREGKLARFEQDNEGEYWVCTKVYFPDFFNDDGIKIIRSDKPIGEEITQIIIKEDGSYQKASNDKNSWGISRWKIMSHEWSIKE